MSCYFRHLKNIFNEAGIEVNAGSRKEIDKAFHEIVGVAYKNCPSAWKKLKQEIMNNEQKRQELIRKLRSAAR